MTRIIIIITKGQAIAANAQARKINKNGLDNISVPLCKIETPNIVTHYGCSWVVNDRELQFLEDANFDKEVFIDVSFDEALDAKGLVRLITELE